MVETYVSKLMRWMVVLLGVHVGLETCVASAAERSSDPLLVVTDTGALRGAAGVGLRRAASMTRCSTPALFQWRIRAQRPDRDQSSQRPKNRNHLSVPGGLQR